MFITTISSNLAYDPDYSRIYLSSTFIHEAFHAKLRQKALEVFGSTEIQNWPKAIDDMTLKELSDYVEINAKAKCRYT